VDQETVKVLARGEAGGAQLGDCPALYRPVNQQGKDLKMKTQQTKFPQAALPVTRFDNKNMPLKIVNNGHTIHVKYGSGRVITVGERRAPQETWARMPKTEGKKQEIPGVQINAFALLPDDTTYYTYAGSVTTPPCSEEVRWLVLKTPADVSPEQINTFVKLYPDNARPIQPIGTRL
jgi:carbonic anhydrase